MTKYYIRGHFSDWTEVSKKKYIEFITKGLAGVTTGEKGKAKFLERHTKIEVKK